MSKLTRVISAANEASKVRQMLSEHDDPQFATFTRKAVPPKPIVTDESLLPGKFWKLPPPTIDKTAVNDAVKAGEDIPGVIMSNGSETIQVRRQ